jgi:hypothetical protein
LKNPCYLLDKLEAYRSNQKDVLNYPASVQQFWDSTRSTLLKNKSEFLQQGRLDVDKATSVLCRHLEERQIIELFDFLFEIN